MPAGSTEGRKQHGHLTSPGSSRSFRPKSRFRERPVTGGCAPTFPPTPSVQRRGVAGAPRRPIEPSAERVANDAPRQRIHDGGQVDEAVGLRPKGAAHISKRIAAADAGDTLPLSTMSPSACSSRVNSVSVRKRSRDHSGIFLDRPARRALAFRHRPAACPRATWASPNDNRSTCDTLQPRPPGPGRAAQAPVGSTGPGLPASFTAGCGASGAGAAAVGAAAAGAACRRCPRRRCRRRCRRALPVAPRPAVALLAVAVRVRPLRRIARRPVAAVGLGLRRLGGELRVDDPLIVLGVLQIVLRRDAVPRRQGVARERLIALVDLGGTALHLDVGAVALEVRRQSVPVAVARPAAAITFRIRRWFHEIRFSGHSTESRAPPPAVTRRASVAGPWRKCRRRHAPGWPGAPGGRQTKAPARDVQPFFGARAGGGAGYAVPRRAERQRIVPARSG